jgi:hypothetical protein
VLEDPLRRGCKYCHTYFEMGDGHVLAFFEHTTLFNPKDFTARCGSGCHVALNVGKEEMVRQFKCRLDAADIANRLLDDGVSHRHRPTQICRSGCTTVRIGGATPLANGRADEESITGDIGGVTESIRFHQLDAIAERIIDVHATIAFEGLIVLQDIS